MVLPPPEDERTPKREFPFDEPPRQSPRFTEQDLQAFKYFDLLQPLLQRLHDAGTERDRAGNRQGKPDSQGANHAPTIYDNHRVRP
jgi:hypothetical protein